LVSKEEFVLLVERESEEIILSLAVEKLSYEDLVLLVGLFDLFVAIVQHTELFC
jgi:hypothetical protein